MALGTGTQAKAEANTTLEREVKAAYIYKFLSYVQWPADTFRSPDSPVAIGVAGDAKLFAELTRVAANRAINERRISVRQVGQGDSVADLQVLYLSDINSVPLQARGLLTITDRAGLVAGAVVDFRRLDGRVRFDVSVSAAERNGIKLSSRLLSVAATVEGGK